MFIRAQSYFQNAQYKEAIADLDILIASQGEKPLLLEWKANSTYAAKDFKVAERYYRTLLRKPAPHDQLKEYYKKVVLCEYFGDNYEGAAWDVAFMESRGYERDTVFERRIIQKEVSFDETTLFETPNITIGKIEEQLNNYCPVIDMKWRSEYYHTELGYDVLREKPVTDLTALLPKRLMLKD